MALGLLGFVTDPERDGSSSRRSAVRSARVAVLGAPPGASSPSSLSTLPQVLYLVSRNVDAASPPRHARLSLPPGRVLLRFGRRQLRHRWQPGLPERAITGPAYAELMADRIPLHLGSGLGRCRGGVPVRGARRAAHAAGLLSGQLVLPGALAMLGKGAPGLVLPIVAALGFVAVTRAAETSAARAGRPGPGRRRAWACPGTCRCSCGTVRRSSIG